MKKSFLILIFIFIPVFFFASPFGLKMGMTLDEITEVCDGNPPVQINDDCYSITPSKKHPLFKQYLVFVDSSKGLYCIKALSDDIKTNDYGTEIKNAFSEIKGRVSKTYGTPKVIDEIAPDSLWKDDKYWVDALSDGARTYAAIWTSNAKTKLNDDLDAVAIYAKAQKYPRIGCIFLQYDFNNMQAVEDSQDDVF